MSRFKEFKRRQSYSGPSDTRLVLTPDGRMPSTVFVETGAPDFGVLDHRQLRDVRQDPGALRSLAGIALSNVDDPYLAATVIAARTVLGEPTPVPTPTPTGWLECYNLQVMPQPKPNTMPQLPRQ